MVVEDEVSVEVAAGQSFDPQLLHEEHLVGEGRGGSWRGGGRGGSECFVSIFGKTHIKASYIYTMIHTHDISNRHM